MDNKPLVSVIVPVYNSERYLRRCLDSLVYQTLENIEIICVNNGSDDSSLEILEEYKALFPDKMVVITTEHFNRAGHGRNVGMQNARADYISFCDSDDMFHLKALEWMHVKAMEGNYDIVFSPYYRVADRTISVGGKFNQSYSPTPLDLLISASPSVWGKIIHKSLIERIGYMPETFSAEDIAYSFMLHTYAANVAYVKNPTYYYINRSDSEVRVFLSPKKLENVDSQNYGIQNGNQEYREAIIANIARLDEGHAKSDWVFADHFIGNLKRNRELIENNEFFMEYYPKVYDSVERYLNLTDEPMERVVYANGFGGISDERVQYLKEKAFYPEAQVVVLDASNCDVNEIPEIKSAFDSGNFDFVAKYFAMKRMYEAGGIYIGDSIRIDAPLNFVRYFPAFFGYMDSTSFTDEVFGGNAGNVVLKRILDTFENGGRYRDKMTPMCDRIRNILVVGYDVSLARASTSVWGYDDFVLMGPEVLVVDPTIGLGGLFPQMHFTTHDFSKFAGDDEYVTLKYSTLRALYAGGTPNANVSVNKQLKALRAKVHEYENSDSWLITAPLRKFSRTKFGSVFLKVYRKLMKQKDKT